MGRVRGTVNAIMAHLAASFQCRLQIRHLDRAYSSAAAYECNRLCRHGSGVGGAMRSRMGELRFRIGSFQQGLSWRTDIRLRFPQMRKTGSTVPGPVRRKPRAPIHFLIWQDGSHHYRGTLARSLGLATSSVRIPARGREKARLRGGDGRSHRLAESWGFEPQIPLWGILA